MKCSKCSAYRKDVRRCGYGKINPLSVSIKQGVETASIMGTGYFCDASIECTAKKEKIVEAFQLGTILKKRATRPDTENVRCSCEDYPCCGH